jgi:hypothetical protein
MRDTNVKLLTVQRLFRYGATRRGLLSPLKKSRRGALAAGFRRRSGSGDHTLIFSDQVVNGIGGRSCA